MNHDAPPRLGPRAFTLLLFALALLPRVWVAWTFDGPPAWDGRYYHIGATSIARGLGYVGESGGPWCHYPVGYSAFVAGAYKLFGAAPIVATLLNAFVGAALACCTYWLARHALSEKRARVAGILTASYPGLVVYTAVLMTEPLATLTLVVGALIAARGSRRGSLLAGVIFGFGALVRPQSLLLAPCLGLFARGTWRSKVVGGLIATAATLAVVAPWSLRNCRVMDGCALVSTNAGWNLAIGSFPRATGRFETLRAGDGCHIVTGQVQQDRCWMEHGAHWIAEDPSRWFGLIPDKLGFTFDHESFVIGYLAEMDESRWSERRRQLGRGVLSWSFRALLSAALFALLTKPSRQRPLSLLLPFFAGLLVWYAAATVTHPFWLVALALLGVAGARARALSSTTQFAALAVFSVALTHAVFFGEDRYHVVLVPFLCILAAKVGAESRLAPP